MPSSLKTNLQFAGIILAGVYLVGTIGYYILGLLAAAEPSWGLIDCFYMTVITLTTVGYGEIIDVASVPGARIFTVIILMGGLGISAYFLSTITAFLVDGELNNIFWRKKMKKEIDKLTGHIIICGGGRVGHYILTELKVARRSFVLIEPDEKRVLELQGLFGTFPAVIGDATHDYILREAGVEKASGVISALVDDKDNLCVVVTCRQLNPNLEIISRCRGREFANKLELIGAKVVIPNFIGGLRMASQMIRPRVVRYLDTMLREKENVVRIEEMTLSETSDLVSKNVGSLDLKKYGNLLLLAILQQKDGKPLYNPAAEYSFNPGDTLVFQSEPDAIELFRKKHA